MEEPTDEKLKKTIDNLASEKPLVRVRSLESCILCKIFILPLFIKHKGSVSQDINDVKIILLYKNKESLKNSQTNKNQKKTQPFEALLTGICSIHSDQTAEADKGIYKY